MTNFAVLMDPIASINPKKDTSLAILLAAQARGMKNYYMTSQDLWYQNGEVWGRMFPVTVFDDANHWYELKEPIVQPLAALNVLMMRKDPPFNMDYIYLTYLLEQAEAQGLLVVNKPASLRDANEKLFTLWFPQCCPKTLVTSKPELIKEFVSQQGEVVIKPLDGMGGHSIFRVKKSDPNLNVIVETMAQRGLVMVQQFLSDISHGDKRIFIVDGKAVPYTFARVPAKDDFRGNLAAGATPDWRELTDRDRWICQQVGPTLKKKGLVFVGLDVIGDYLTEINVTSPTGVRELQQHFDINVADQLLAAVDIMLK